MAVKNGARKPAAFVLALYVGGLLALLFHLATEQHFVAPRGASAGHPTLVRLCPCQQHTPHAAGDHDANMDSDGPTTGPTLDDLTLAPAAAPLAPPLLAPGTPPLEATPLRVPIERKLRPKQLELSKKSDRPRAPPVA